MSAASDLPRRYSWWRPRLQRIYERLPIMYCLGSLLLFLSWVSDYEFQQKQRASREEIDQARTRIAINDALANTWLSTLVQLEAMNAEPHQKASAALQYVNFSGQVMSAAASEAIGVVDKRLGIAESRRELVRTTVARMKRGEYPAVIRTAYEMREIEEAVATVITDAIAVKYRRVEAKERRANWFVRFFYIAGAILVAIAFIRDRLSPRGGLTSR
jgi:hypothetical protein